MSGIRSTGQGTEHVGDSFVMTVNIPQQLKRTEFRFVLVSKRAKAPVEKQWTTINNYRVDNQKLRNWLAQSGNYGVCCGYGGLVVVDSDDPLIAERSQERLGVTFRVRSGSGRGFHDYFTVEGMHKKEIFEPDGKHLGEAQFVGQMVIGPGSMHPSGGIYEIVNDTPICNVTVEKFTSAFRDVVRVQKTYELPTGAPSHEARDTLQALALTAVLYGFNGNYRGRYLHGKNPWHGARTGTNFTIDTEANLWTCWRCHCRGGVARAIALKHGLLANCPDVLSKAEYRRVIDLAKRHYGWR